MEVALHSFLTCIIDGGAWPASGPGLYHLVGGLADTRIGLGTAQKKNALTLPTIEA